MSITFCFLIVLLSIVPPNNAMPKRKKPKPIGSQQVTFENQGDRIPWWIDYPNPGHHPDDYKGHTAHFDSDAIYYPTTIGLPMATLPPWTWQTTTEMTTTKRTKKPNKTKKTKKPTTTQTKRRKVDHIEKLGRFLICSFTAAAQCPNGWNINTRFRKCYKLIGGGYDFNQAASACKRAASVSGLEMLLFASLIRSH